MSIHSFPRPAKVATADRPLTLGFLSPHNPHDRRAFSGTAFFAARALERRADLRLRLLGGHRPPRALDRLLGRRAPPAAAVGKDDLDGLDGVVGLVATPLLDRLYETRPDLPFLHVTDATPAFLRDAYGWAVPAEADVAEARVAARAGINVYSSGTLAARAAGDLGLRHMATAALPFGVNLETLPGQPPEKPSLNRVELLFVGIDWGRKGGDVAVAALDALVASGRDARLTIVGRCPERHRDHPAVRAMGFLDKNRPRAAARLARLYASSHLLLVPSRADCTPMVVAEAMAHATPVIATDVGGLREQIGGAGAGRCLPPYTDPGIWARTIAAMTGDAAGYALASDAAFDRAQARFAWDVWAEGIEAMARRVCAQRPVGLALGA